MSNEQEAAKEIILLALRTNRAAVYKALVLLYRRQTSTEQAGEHTTDANGRGFSMADARLLTSFAKQVLQGKTLSDKQMFYARKLLPKYWRQLSEEREAKLAALAARDAATA